MNENRLEIETNAMRIEFEGVRGPTRLLVPLIVPVGTHSKVDVRIRPRPGVVLRNEVETGDTLNTTLSRSHTTTGGAAFFASASHGRTFGIGEKPYEVVSLTDFCGVRFRIKEYIVHDEPVGLLLSFPIDKCDLSSTDDYFADITLEQGGNLLQKCRVEREVHPNAGRVLVLTGYSEEFHKRHLTTMSSQIATTRRPFLECSLLTQFDLSNLRQIVSNGYDAVHLYTNVSQGTMLVNDQQIDSDEFFQKLDGLELRFIYIDTCNSVQVVSAFRRTDINAMIAATENLEVSYANDFERVFYESLGMGDYISVAFQKATACETKRSSIHMTRSGKYDPMFLDLKTDSRFGSNKPLETY
ncbi:MAG: hypothetical protein AB4063_10455 [Crocosphaera sp.]